MLLWLMACVCKIPVLVLLLAFMTSTSGLTLSGVTDNSEEGLEPGGWDDPDIVDSGRKWWKIPDPFFKPGDARPYPPTVDYHVEATRNSSSIMVLIAALRETKLLKTLQFLFDRAQVPSRVYAGIVQQNAPGDADVLEEFCRLRGTPLELRNEFHSRADLQTRQRDEDVWGHSRYTPASLARCEPAIRIRMHRMDAKEAKGPAYARARQPLLLSQGPAIEDFCMQLDAHTVFTKGWDERILKEWAATENEYAVLSTYPTGAEELNAEGDPPNINKHWEMPHLCSAELNGPGIVHNSIAGAAANLRKPALSKLWAAGLSFSKCHAERDVPADPRMFHIFSGEEFGRGARLWTNGYDFYTLSRPVIGTWYGDRKGGEGGWETNEQEASLGRDRLATLVRYKGANLSGQAIAALQGYDLGKRRALDDYIALTGVDTVNNSYTQTSCLIRKWTPWKPDAQLPYTMLETSPVKLGVAITAQSAASPSGSALLQDSHAFMAPAAFHHKSDAALLRRERD